jgi:hypothetical protein
VDTYDPELAVEAACTHPNPLERLSREEAIWFFTTGSRLNQSLDPGRIGAGARVWLTP